jgi:hypothetical protein
MMTSANAIKLGVFALCIGLYGCERQISFAADVQPILAEHCIECHNETAEGYAASGFSLADYEAVMQGRKFGPVVLANDSDSSVLYLVIAHKTGREIHMPPHHDEAMAEGRGNALPTEYVETVRAWIEQGALNN